MDEPFRPKVLTPKMLAERWQCSERHVRNLIASNRLPAFRIGAKLVRIRSEDVEAFERNTAEQPSIANVPTAKKMDAMSRARIEAIRGSAKARETAIEELQTSLARKPRAKRLDR